LGFPLWGEPDIDEAFSRPRDVLDELRGYLAAHSRNLAVRWTVLAFLYDLSQVPDSDDEAEWYPLHGRDASDRARFREELKVLVSLPDLADLTEPKRLRWEIQNSCFASDLGQAERLLTRLQEVEPAKAPFNYALLGEFHLLRALSARPDDLVHCALGLASPAVRLALRLSRWAVALDDPTGVEDDSRLRDARYSLEKADQGGFRLPAHAAAALGRCLFIEGNHRQAATRFEGVLDAGGVALAGGQAQFNDELNAALLLAVARSHERAGDSVRAKMILERCLGTFPKYGPAFRRLAELAITMNADYEGAYRVLARWADVEPQLESDIWVRTLRGLGDTKGGQSVQRMLDEFFDAHPERLRWVESAVRSHWPALDRLSERARKQWLYGSWILWWRPPGFQAVDHADAAAYFSRTLEIELRRVFNRFIDGLGELTDLRADMDRPRPNARGKAAWERLLEGRGTLGEMLTELDPARESVLLASTRFREWLGKEFPKLVHSFIKEEADQINLVRRTSTHEGEETRERAETACVLCRKYLDSLLDPG
jgi:tetratricopeptide (TPR) repeat protein